MAVTGRVIGEGGNYSGTYTATVNNVANISNYVATDTLAFNLNYIVVGDNVFVNGRVDITTALANTSTDLAISLPIESNLTSSTSDLFGSINSWSGTQVQTGAFIADVANDGATVKFKSGTVAGSTIMIINFTYKIK